MGKKIVYKKNNWISTEYIANEFDKYVKRELLISVNNATRISSRVYPTAYAQLPQAKSLDQHLLS